MYFENINHCEALTPTGDHRMKQLILGAALVGIGTVIGALSSNLSQGC